MIDKHGREWSWPCSSEAVTGLRERKKLRTRTDVMEATLDLCARNGFDNTTVEQIAAAADISPRTFNRYFASKEEAVLAPIDYMIDATVEILGSQPRTGNELKALRDTYTQLLESITERGLPFDFERWKQIHQIIHESPSVSARRGEWEKRKAAAVSQKVAERIGVTPDDLSVRLTMAVWQAILHTADNEWAVCSKTSMGNDPELFVATVDATFDRYIEMAGQWSSTSGSSTSASSTSGSCSSADSPPVYSQL